jgi:hypothetical protein
MGQVSKQAIPVLSGIFPIKMTNIALKMAVYGLFCWSTKRTYL